MVSHLSSIWNTIPPICFLGFVISLQMAQTESDAETRKAQLQTALDGLLVHASQADHILQYALQKLDELESSVHTPADWCAFSHQTRQDLERVEAIRQASSTLDMAVRQTTRACEEASGALAAQVSSEELLARLLEMHKVEEQQQHTSSSSRPVSPSGRHPTAAASTPARMSETWSAAPLRLPNLAKRASLRSTGSLSDGGVLPVSPNSPVDVSLSRAQRHPSLIRRRRPSNSVDHGNFANSSSSSSRRAMSSPGLRRTMSARASVDSPLRRSALSSQVDEDDHLDEEESETSYSNMNSTFDVGRSESYAKLTRKPPSPATPHSPATPQYATYSHKKPSPELLDPLERYWGVPHHSDGQPSLLDQPSSAPPMAQERRRSHIGAVTGLLPSTMPNSSDLARSASAGPAAGRQHQSTPQPVVHPAHHRRMSSSIFNSGQPLQTQSPVQDGRQRNKRFSLLSQHSLSSQRSSPHPGHFTPGLLIEQSSPSLCYSSEQPMSQHLSVLHRSFDQMHRERRRFLCTLMAVDFNRMLSRSPEKLGDISRSIVSVADDLEHLQLVAKRELDRLCLGEEVREEGSKRSSWSPLLPGAWTPQHARSSTHLSPLDLPFQHQPSSSSSSARRRQSEDVVDPHVDFAPPSSPLHRFRTSSNAFGSKRNNMSRGLRAIAAKLDLASDELEQRLATVGVRRTDASLEAEREQDLLTVHDSIRSDLEHLLRDWDESRVLLRSALHPPSPQDPKSRRRTGLGLNDSALGHQSREEENVKDLDESSDEPSMPSLTHSGSSDTTTQKRSSSLFSFDDAHTPDGTAPPHDVTALDSSPDAEGRTPTGWQQQQAPLEQVFEAVATKERQRSTLTREERIRLAKAKREGQQESDSQAANDAQPNPMLSGGCRRTSLGG